MTVTIPIKVLHEAVGLVVTLDLENNSTVCGRLASIDDSCNVVLEDVEIEESSGRKSARKSIFVRGSRINFFVLPPALKFAPFLTKGGHD